mmetsp:Transcript_113093/g.365299  ORF Transcript_113093/g.365299 Transcript_113093/m.365299 type:complete len:272 (-) Transcript_113093:726-1541(-)
MARASSRPRAQRKPRCSLSQGTGLQVLSAPRPSSRNGSTSVSREGSLRASAVAKQSMKSLRTPPMSRPCSPTNSTRRPSIWSTESSCRPGTSCAVMPNRRFSTERSAICVRPARTRSPWRRTTMGAMELCSTAETWPKLVLPPASRRCSCRSCALAEASSWRSVARLRCARSLPISDTERMSLHASRVILTLRQSDASSTLPTKSVERCRALASSAWPRSDCWRSWATCSNTTFCSTMGSRPKRLTTALLQGTIIRPQGRKLTMPQTTTVR